MRYWASLDQVACWVRDQGATECSVDARHYWPPERAAIPNATTINAIAELNAGNGKRFVTAGALFRASSGSDLAFCPRVTGEEKGKV